MTGVALLGGIARFNEMTPAAQASLLDNAGETVRDTAQSWLHGAVVVYNEVTGGGDHDQPRTAPPRNDPHRNTSLGPPPGTEGQGGDAAAPPPRSAVRTADAGSEAPSGNPLWVLPLTQLSTTRERPLFSPSRRPPPPPRPAFVAPVAIQQPVPPPVSERPKDLLILLGTIVGTNPDDRLAVFQEIKTQNVVHLHIGDTYQGWVLRLVKARDVTLVKDGEEPGEVELPPPGEGPPPGFGAPRMPPPPPPQLTPPVPPPSITPRIGTPQQRPPRARR